MPATSLETVFQTIARQPEFSEDQTELIRLMWSNADFEVDEPFILSVPTLQPRNASFLRDEDHIAEARICKLLIWRVHDAHGIYVGVVVPFTPGSLLRTADELEAMPDQSRPLFGHRFGVIATYEHELPYIIGLSDYVNAKKTGIWHACPDLAICNVHRAVTTELWTYSRHEWDGVCDWRLQDGFLKVRYLDGYERCTV